jgi:hypothetical protein
VSCGIHFSFFEDMGEFMREAGRDVKTFFAGRRDWLVMLAAVGLCILGVTYAISAQLTPGDILVIDQSAGTDFRGALFRIDPQTGTRTVLSDFGKSTQGRLGGDPVGVAVEMSGSILVTDHFAGTDFRGVLFRVHPQSRTRAVLSDFGDGSQGPLGANPLGVAVEVAGTILVTDHFAGTNSRGALFRIDPQTGTRTVLSDFGDSAQGPLGDPVGVAVETSGTILVSNSVAGTDSRGALFRVDPQTGTRTVLSDGNASQGSLGTNSLGVGVEVAGTVLVGNSVAGTNLRGALFRVDPETGTRTLLSDFGDSGQGPVGEVPLGVAVEGTGTILVSNSVVGTNFRAVLFRLDPQTGTRAVLSDFGDAGQGPVGGALPAAVAVVPMPAVNIADLSHYQGRQPGPSASGR